MEQINRATYRIESRLSGSEGGDFEGNTYTANLPDGNIRWERTTKAQRAQRAQR